MNALDNYYFPNSNTGRDEGTATETDDRYDANFKHLRQTEHTHDPLDDAKGNAEALLAIKEQYGLRISL